MSSSESGGEVRITLTVGYKDDQVTENLTNLKSAVQQTGTEFTNVTPQVTGFTYAVNGMNVKLGSTGGVIRNALNPVRVMSRDLWALGYSLNRLNIHFLGNNETVKKFTHILIGAGAALRIVATIQNLTNNTQLMNSAIKAATVIWKFFNMELKMSAFWISAASFGIGMLAGAATFAAVSASAPKSYASGGTVPSTGMYYLHKGETVSNEVGPDYSQININITTGPLNSSMDVDRVFNDAAIKMARERRRRGL